MTDLQGLVDTWVEKVIEDLLDELEDQGYTDKEVDRALLYHNQFWTAWKDRTANA